MSSWRCRQDLVLPCFAGAILHAQEGLRPRAPQLTAAAPPQESSRLNIPSLCGRLRDAELCLGRARSSASRQTRACAHNNTQPPSGRNGAQMNLDCGRARGRVCSCGVRGVRVRSRTNARPKKPSRSRSIRVRCRVPVRSIARAPGQTAVTSVRTTIICVGECKGACVRGGRARTRRALNTTLQGRLVQATCANIVATPLVSCLFSSKGVKPQGLHATAVAATSSKVSWTPGFNAKKSSERFRLNLSEPKDNINSCHAPSRRRENGAPISEPVGPLMQPRKRPQSGADHICVKAHHDYVLNVRATRLVCARSASPLPG